LKAFEGSDACSGSGARDGTAYTLCRHEAPPFPSLQPFPAAAPCTCIIFVFFFPRGLFHFPFPLPCLFLSFLQRTGPSFAVVRGVEAIPLRAITFEGPAAYVSTNKESFLSLVSPFFFFLLFFFFEWS
jgi:hypothetical protein